MKEYVITYKIKVRDLVKAYDQEQALQKFRAKYPAALDKEATLEDIHEFNK